MVSEDGCACFFSFFFLAMYNGMNTTMTMTMFRVGFQSWGTFFFFFSVAGYGLVWAVCLDG